MPPIDSIQKSRRVHTRHDGRRMGNKLTRLRNLDDVPANVAMRRPEPMNPKVECVICAINNLESSGEIRVSVADARPLKDGESLSDLKFSHFALSPETYRSMGLMVGDLVTLEMAKV
jgi:hypothetical protein